MLQANFTVSPLSGDVNSSEFTFTDKTSGGSVYKYIWDFGLNEYVYNETSPKFTFKYPGTYNVSLSVTDFDGNESNTTQQITVDLAYRDYLKFTQIPEKYATPGKKTETPFKIEILSSNIDNPLLVDLYSANSNSVPYNFVPTKWNFLVPTWKFLDKNSNFITTLSVDPVKVYKNNKVVAISGVGEFYYVDSMSTGNPNINSPLIITATLQTSGFNFSPDSSVYSYPSYANNESVRAAILWLVDDVFPTRLKITGNYLNPIDKTQWQGVKIPILISCHSNRSDLIPGSKDELSEIIFSYPYTNNTNTVFSNFYETRNPIASYLVLENTTGYLLQENKFKILLENPEYSQVTIPLLDSKIEDAPLFFQKTDENNFRIGGYIFTTLTPFSTASSASIEFKTQAVNPQADTSNFIYPAGFSPNPSVWVSNPQQSTLNKITLIPNNKQSNTINYFKNKKLLVDGSIKEIKVPSVSSSNTTNYTLSGFSGICSLAIDPRQYDLIAADSELDRIYKISNEGEILKTFNLSSIGDYNPKKKMFYSWNWLTPSPQLSSTNFSFYDPSFKSDKSKNFIGALDGKIVPSVRLARREDKPQSIRIITLFPDHEPSWPLDPPGTPNSINTYPDENLDFNVIQIFSPLLPSTYIDSLSTWTIINAVGNGPTQIFELTGVDLPNNVNPNRFIVSVDGVYQTPFNYTISDINNTVGFFNPVNERSIVNVHYIAKSLEPAFWSFTLIESTSSLFLPDHLNYVADPEAGFLVFIDNKLTNPKNFYFDVENRSLIFNKVLETNTQIHVTQITVEENINAPVAYTPSYVSLDKDYNIWVTLFDSVSVLKFDPELNLLFSTAPNNIHWDRRAWTNSPSGIDYQSSLFGFQARYTAPNEPDLDEYTDEFFLKPTVAETDKQNNCWVTYSNPLCSILVKYNPSGVPLNEIPTGLYSTPTSLAINSFNNVWVANTYNSSYLKGESNDNIQTPNVSLSGSLKLYDSETGNLIKIIEGFSKPSHLCIDRENNLWFTQSNRRISYYDTTTELLSTWTLELTGGFTPSNDLLSYQEENENDQIGGMATDIYNRVWILDNLQNFVWVISSTPNFENGEIRSFKARPDNLIGYYPDLNDGSTEINSGNFYFESINAAGDWTGNRWYQKYITYSTLSSVTLSGVSNSFTIYDFNNPYQIRRINESFNNAEYFKNLALPENLNNNSILFDDFFGAAVGTGYLSANEDLGQTIYEKIANFTSNHADIDTCNISQLLSIAQQVNQPFDQNFNVSYPSEIKRLLDIFSISKSKLWGIKNKIPLFPQSIGNTLNMETVILTAGSEIIARNIFDNSIQIISIPEQDGFTTYPLLSFYGYGLEQPLFSHYIFYEFKPKYSEEYIENIIDWNSDFTFLSPSLSSNKEWYGSEGAIENYFRYILTKNLIVK
jgi:hypothetical protein